MKILFRSLSLALLGCGLSFLANAQNITLKIASLAPENSDYGRIMNQINAEWIKVSSGKVRMQIIHNGAAGGEDEVLRKMKLGTIQGGMFISVGLGRISLPVITMSTPLLIKNDAQMKYILKQLRPTLDQTFRDKGYVPITYARAGWVYAFSKEAFQLPTDIKKRKIAVSDTDKAFFATFQAMNYSPISVSFNEYITALNSGLIDTFLSSPIAAAQYQWFGIAKYMLDLPMAPFIGGLLVDDRAWARVSPDLQQALINAANNVVATALDPAAERLEKEAITIMKNNGLNVMPAQANTRSAWTREFEVGVPKLISSGAIDKATYERIQSLLAGFKE